MEPLNSPEDQHSPYAVAENLLQSFLDEEVSDEDFLAAVERFSEHVQSWRDHLDGIALPENEDAEENRVLLQGALQGVESIIQGVDCLGLLPENPQDELVEEALQKILEGQNLLKQVQGITDMNVTSAIDDARYMD